MKILEYLKRPAIAAAAAGVGGILLGLIWGWVIQPVRWVDAPPALLNSSSQETYLRMAIDSFAVNGDTQLALQRYEELGDAAPERLMTIQTNPGKQDPNAILRFSNLVKGVESTTAVTPGETPQPSAAATPTDNSLPSLISKLLRYGLIALGVLVVAVVAFALYWYLSPKFRRRGDAGATTAAGEMPAPVEAPSAGHLAPGKDAPIAQYMTTYVLGDDLFDDSFGIDSPSGEFLGECGVGISETIGVGDPKKVSVFEVWLFDKNDIQTVTKVLMSSHAYNDVATYQRLHAKGEPVLVELGKQFMLETAALQMVATVSDVEYGKGALPESSYFERLTLELAIWPKTVQQG